MLWPIGNSCFISLVTVSKLSLILTLRSREHPLMGSHTTQAWFVWVNLSGMLHAGHCKGAADQCYADLHPLPERYPTPLVCSCTSGQSKAPQKAESSSPLSDIRSACANPVAKAWYFPSWAQFQNSIMSINAIGSEERQSTHETTDRGERGPQFKAPLRPWQS